MKSAVLCLLVLGAVLVTSLPALPTAEDLQTEGEGLAVEDFGAVEEVHGGRFRRATCDLLSFSSKWVTPNHAGCAAHCIFKGYKGGSCKKTVCHCRR